MTNLHLPMLLLLLWMGTPYAALATERAPLHHATSGDGYAKAMSDMDAGMKAPMSGDPDRDFATMMIAHHRGAIAMAKVELEHGRDPHLRTLAQTIIAAQEREIASMHEWLARHPR